MIFGLRGCPVTSELLLSAQAFRSFLRLNASTSWADGWQGLTSSRVWAILRQAFTASSTRASLLVGQLHQSPRQMHTRMRISSQNANGWPGSTVCDGHTSWGPMDGRAVMRSKTLSRAGTRRIAATNPYTAAKRCGNTCTLNGALWHHRLLWLNWSRASAKWSQTLRSGRRWTNGTYSTWWKEIRKSTWQASLKPVISRAIGRGSRSKC
mmetsp:Transcript_68293/g.150135  ORF Transcript_68293/g.150135 Transcript_68293/m.150135 type:complete len:209 (-) Transcript_68293:286-912(-)